jgi:hypothetical protein
LIVVFSAAVAVAAATVALAVVITTVTVATETITTAIPVASSLQSLPPLLTSNLLPLPLSPLPPPSSPHFPLSF